jgi:hypothetical protein
MRRVRRFLTHTATVVLLAGGAVAVTAAPAAASGCSSTSNGYGFVHSSGGGETLIYLYHNTSCTGSNIGWVSVDDWSAPLWELQIVDSTNVTMTIRMWYTNGKSQYHLTGPAGKITIGDVLRSEVGSPAPNNWWLEVGTTTNSKAYGFPTG